MPINTLEPQPLWTHFCDLNAIPRASKNERKAIEFVKKFGDELRLETLVDRVGNVIIKKPASPGMEDRPVVALQGHLDMVHQKNAGTTFDFDTEGIRMGRDGDWVRAEGTTLGADNGIGVAAIMAVLASKSLRHPPLEALFTIDEETGMSGAKGFQAGLLSARYLLNLDTEDDRELTIGCAGGVDVLGSGRCETVPTPPDHRPMKVVIQGLTGGHSGTDIHLGRANANKLMNRLLYIAAERFGVRVSSIDGGGLRNAIPRESTAVVAVPAGAVEGFRAFVAEEQSRFQSEYQTTDPGLTCQTEDAGAAPRVLEPRHQERLLQALYALPHGIYRMSPDVPGLVQTSNNLARVLVRDGELSVQCLSRGSLDSERDDQATAVACALKLLGVQVELAGDYPGWAPKPESAIVKLMTDLYRRVFGEEPHVNACHAGLECGILGKNYPDMEMISFGPNIRGAHSPDETVQVSSVQKFWRLLTATLEGL
ncbi:MAG: aminoacyl-histidine dipeptidase [Armatimonadetes bacterium]|nr:aminoacyl-histidine dipeptidase [Armatimonadota bacterium]